MYKLNICRRQEQEEKYIYDFNPQYNILKYTLASVEGNKEGSQATQLLNKKYTYTEETKANFKGEKNSFFGCKHTEETKNLQSEIKKGKQNPMYGKEKSPEFLYYMTKDRTGPNNPMYGKKKGPETIKKLSKPVYQYDAATKNLIMTFPGFVIAERLALKMGSDTLKKYINTGNVYNDKYIFSFSFPL